jgi:phosphohistidine phosphatase SixA
VTKSTASCVGRPAGGPLPSPAVTLFLVRHAHAGSRSHWEGADADRPLSDKGWSQVEAITAHLADAPIKRVLASAAVR